MKSRKNFTLINKKGYKKLHKYCFFCGEDDYDALQCHRIIPGAESGGIYEKNNIISACASCHEKIHSSRIKIDRKYTSTLGKTVVHYWVDGKEFWKPEEIGYFIDNFEEIHKELGKSKKI